MVCKREEVARGETPAVRGAMRRDIRSFFLFHSKPYEFLPFLSDLIQSLLRLIEPLGVPAGIIVHFILVVARDLIYGGLGNLKVFGLCVDLEVKIPQGVFTRMEFLGQLPGHNAILSISMSSSGEITS